MSTQNETRRLRRLAAKHGYYFAVSKAAHYGSARYILAAPDGRFLIDGKLRRRRADQTFGRFSTLAQVREHLEGVAAR